MACLKNNGEELLRIRVVKSSLTDPIEREHLFSYRSNGWVLSKSTSHDLETGRKYCTGWKRYGKMKATAEQYYNSFSQKTDQFTILYYKPTNNG